MSDDTRTAEMRKVHASRMARIAASATVFDMSDSDTMETRRSLAQEIANMARDTVSDFDRLIARRDADA